MRRLAIETKRLECLPFFRRVDSGKANLVLNLVAVQDRQRIAVCNRDNFPAQFVYLPFRSGEHQRTGQQQGDGGEGAHPGMIACGPLGKVSYTPLFRPPPNVAQSAMEPPIVLAFLLCNHVWRDPDTGGHSIIGTFSGIGGFVFPLTRYSMTVFFSLTGGRGIQPMRLELVDVDEERNPIFATEGDIHFLDPREVIDLGIEFKNVTFPQPGNYRVKLFVGGEFLMERKLEVTLAGT